MVGFIGGMLMAVAGILAKCFPPRSINSVYGYRTRRSMSNGRQWQEGNRFSASLMIILGLFAAAAGVASDRFISINQPFSLILQITYLAAACALTIVMTERSLKSMGGERNE
ncbi:SdpI family protein [Bacillus sp. ISL-51]|uniref:SdpI family protein n=1 Tax=Bacteria TaxID=2 RepID=UPI001BE9787A|nr:MULTISPECIES: SdpI family protein [Bacteria]MBT2572397.1 SdpI family protein [Bacillus sp. ISL-51]MBT2634333.1 SdpI family protein [Bacillus sp. ISL-26]MBT2711458.1 SdpI family protein [Pseudomonas sp. ISL-88]